eukprot:8103958-Heterocapsa_arctica.AAC.1
MGTELSAVLQEHRPDSKLRLYEDNCERKESKKNTGNSTPKYNTFETRAEHGEGEVKVERARGEKEK